MNPQARESETKDQESEDEEEKEEKQRKQINDPLTQDVDAPRTSFGGGSGG